MFNVLFSMEYAAKCKYVCRRYRSSRLIRLVSRRDSRTERQLGVCKTLSDAGDVDRMLLKEAKRWCIGRQTDRQAEILVGHRDGLKARTCDGEWKPGGRSRDRMIDGRRIITTAGRETNARSPQNAITQLFW